jgi:hypothetical protein
MGKLVLARETYDGVGRTSDIALEPVLGAPPPVSG